MLVFVAFWILMAMVLSDRLRRAKLAQKSRSDWAIDSIGLLVQGLAIPIVQIVILKQIYSYFIPEYALSGNLHPVLAFCLSFVAVDYLYYWNHRLLHSKWLWRSHLVHHTVTEMDVLGTSRNTVWTSFLIVYVWVHSLLIYLLQDPSYYLWGVSLTAALDLWRHSGLWLAQERPFYRLLCLIFILPQDHAWHHARESVNCNYGANFKVWDLIHGTYYSRLDVPEKIGLETKLSLIQQLFLPN